MRTVALTTNAALDSRAVFIERDTTLSWVQFMNVAILSSDKTFTVATITTSPSSAGPNNNVIAFCGVAGNLLVPVDFPLSKGEYIYLSVGAAGLTLLSFIDPI